MRGTYDSTFLLTPKGEIFAFITGNDSCAEHECGSKPMQSSLCNNASFNDEHEIIKSIRSGVEFSYPQVIDRKKINSNLDKIQFFEGNTPKGEKIGTIVFADKFDEEKYKLLQTELSFGFFSEKDKESVAAWDERSFAFQVRGESLVKKLRSFYEQLQAGDGVFAGTFLKDKNGCSFPGLTIALESKLRPEHRQHIKAAQKKFEDNLLLDAKSRSDELNQIGGTNPGYMWPAWKNGQIGGDVVYHVNPSWDSGKYLHRGPYDFDDLREWILAPKKYELKIAREKDSQNCVRETQ